MNWPNIWAGLGAVAGVGTLILAATIAMGRWLRRISEQNAEQLRRDDEFKADWYGRPARPGVIRELGVMERLSNIEHNTATLPDRVAKVESRQDQLEVQQMRTDQRLDDHLKTHGVLP